MGLMVLFTSTRFSFYHPHCHHCVEGYLQGKIGKITSIINGVHSSLFVLGNSKIF